MWAKPSWALEVCRAWCSPTALGSTLGHLRNDAEDGFPLIFPLPRDLLLVWFWMGKKKSGRQILLNLPVCAECALSGALASLDLTSMEAAPEPALCGAEGQDVCKAMS